MLNLDRKQQLVFIVMLIAILIETGLLLKEKAFPLPDVSNGSEVLYEDEQNTKDIQIEPLKEEPTNQEIKVYVTGQVNKPGVVSIPKESRWEDAVNKAGGLMEDADLLRINLARKLTDGDAVFIPKVNDNPVDPGTAALASSPQDSGKININLADTAALDTLPGIGPTRAEKIIEYRDKNGPFQSIEDIKKISGIGDKIFDDLKDLISIN